MRLILITSLATLSAAVITPGADKLVDDALDGCDALLVKQLRTERDAAYKARDDAVAVKDAAAAKAAQAARSECEAASAAALEKATAASTSALAACEASSAAELEKVTAASAATLKQATDAHAAGVCHGRSDAVRAALRINRSSALTTRPCTDRRFQPQRCPWWG